MVRGESTQMSGRAILAASVLATASAVVYAQNIAPRHSVFEVPLGGSIEQVEQMGATRGYTSQARSTACQESELCKSEANLENLPGTNFLNHAWGWRIFPDRRESFRFVFTAPPNESRVWSAGSDLEFGTWMQPSAAAPLLRDVLQELNGRYGRPGAAFGDGGAQLRPGAQPAEYWWVWDSNRNPVTWGPGNPATSAIRRTCYTALLQTASYPGRSLTGSGNATVTNPKPFLLARQGNCAVAVRVEIGQTRGLVHRISIRMVDFKTGHDALYATTRHISRMRSDANQRRSQSNRPDF